MELDKLNALYEPFDVQTKPGRGNYKYVRSIDVIDRMNKVFGGEWSTQVMEDKVVEDSVIVRVRVLLEDKIGYKYHEGYGSSAIQRYREGNNKGQAIDLGSAYKAAEAMAIRNACSRWGVGLFLEEEVGEQETVFPTPPTPPRPEIPKINIPTTGRTSSTNPNVANVPKEAPVEEVKVEEKKPATKMPNLPPMAKKETPKAKPEAEAKPKAKEAPFPKIPLPKKPNAVPPGDANIPDEGISDVQKAALKGLLTIRGLEYNQLIEDAFKNNEIDYDEIPEADKLSYKEAVAVIKYGNDLFKKNK
jgi:hypothetical protein